MPHHQSQDFIRFIEAAELAGVRHLTAEDLRVVFARHHGFRSRYECGEEPVQLLNVHGPAPPLQLLRNSPRRSNSASVSGSFWGKVRIGKFPSAVYDTTIDSLRSLFPNAGQCYCQEEARQEVLHSGSKEVARSTLVGLCNRNRPFCSRACVEIPKSLRTSVKPLDDPLSRHSAKCLIYQRPNSLVI